MPPARILVSSVVAGLLCGDATPASACSCERLTIPADQATDVPTNLGEILTRYFGTEFELRVVATGELVPVAVTVPDERNDLVRVALLAALSANTTYELAALDLPQPFYLTRFTTGAAADVTAPGAVTITGLTAGRSRYEGGASSCGNDILAVRGDIAGLVDASSLAVRLQHGSE
ncbi:MAG: hypothetical protein H0X17_02195, partial [Deltaproteobacteria bacterium]|nr:hypothetical protein [Deltaproteobacteria bacterium]